MNVKNQGLTIVICSDFGNITGGQAKVAIESAIGLKQRGHRPIFFAATGPVDPSLIAAGVEVECLDQQDLLGNPSRLAAALQGTWNRRAETRLKALLAGLTDAPALVHVHGWAKALSPSIAKPIAASGLPAVLTLHEYFSFCPNGGFYNYQAAHACKLAPLSAACWLTHCDSRNYPRKLWRNARLLIAQKLAHLQDIFSDVITISEFQRAIVTPFIAKSARAHRLSNPISIPDLGPRSDAACGDFIFVGRLSAEKGAFLFAEAARLAGVRPIFVGDGPLAAELAAAFPEAQMLGWQKPDAVQGLMRGARALVFPSLWYEGQPLSVLEAKGLGVPVIVSDGCAGRDEVEDGVTGLWFKSGEAQDLARALRELGDNARVARMSRAAYDAYWRNPPTLDQHLDGLLAIYAGMLDSKLSAPRVLPTRDAPEAAPATAHCEMQE